MIEPALYRGVYYFRSHQLAYDYALANTLPTNRIIQYGRGWAIQMRVSGPYAPDTD